MGLHAPKTFTAKILQFKSLMIYNLQGTIPPPLREFFFFFLKGFIFETRRKHLTGTHAKVRLWIRYHGTISSNHHSSSQPPPPSPPPPPSSPLSSPSSPSSLPLPSPSPSAAHRHWAFSWCRHRAKEEEITLLKTILAKAEKYGEKKGKESQTEIQTFYFNPWSLSNFRQMTEVPHFSVSKLYNRVHLLYN